MTPVVAAPPERPGDVLKRARPFLLALAVVGAALWVRSAYLQTVRHAFFSRKAERQHVGRLTLPAERGAIYSRDGHRMAWNVWFDSVYVVPTLVASPAETAARLAGLLGVDGDSLARRIEAKKRDGKLFLWVKRWAAPEEAARVARAEIPGVGLRKEPRRQYSWGEAGAAVLGFVGVDGRGLAGLEWTHDASLAGRDGSRPVFRDARGRILITSPDEGVVPPRHGEDLHLTLDSCVQAIVDTAVDGAMTSLRATRVTAAVMDVQTGEILALSTRPSFDPNDFRRADPRAFTHDGVSFVYEPGSTFKPFVLALALSRGTVRLDTPFFCHEGEWKVGSRVLRDHHPYGKLTAEDIVVHSSNIGIAQVGMTLAPRDLHAGLGAFGFGRRTGVDLPGEEKGLFRPPARWSRETVRSVPMGYEVATTPIQLLAAFNVFANDGVWVRPHIVRDRPTERRRVLASSVAHQMRGVLEGVVTRGTGTKAQCEYAVAGKTGTARKVGRDGKYRADAHVGSFVAYAPAEDPRVCVVVVVDEPRGGDYYGGAVAAPIAREVIRRTLAYMGVPPSAAAGPAPRAFQGGAQRRR